MVVLVTAVVATTGGCAAPSVDSGAGQASEQAPTASTAPMVPTPEPSGADDLARFDGVNRGVIAADESPGGFAFVDALAEAGFDRASIEVTADTTTLGERADSIQFAVRVDDRCLIGQYGEGSDGYRSMEAGVLGTGGCLVGAAVASGG